MAAPNDIEIVKPPAAFKSSVWKYFGFLKGEGRKSVVCRLCFAVMTYSGNTTNLSTHLRRHHAGTEIKPSTSNSKLFSARSDGTSTPSSTSSSVTAVVSQRQQCLTNFGTLTCQRKDCINRKITEFIVDDLHPFRLVESKKFKELIKVLEPRFKIPSRQFFSETMLPRLYEQSRAEVSRKLRQADAIAYTTDGWTSRATQAYITITAHFIDVNWEVQSFVLQTRLMQEQHTGINIGNVLKQSVEEWDLQDKQLALVSDNASNMVVAAREVEAEPYIRCFAHTINLAAQKGLKYPVLATLLARVRRIVGYFHRSAVAAAALTEKQELLSLPKHKLKIDVCTRWNSAYDMLDRFLEQQPAVFAALLATKASRNTNDVVSLSESDISNAEEVLKALSQLKTATLALCTEQGPTLSLICPLMYKLLTSFEPTEQDTPLIRGLKALMRQDLQPRYTDDMELLRVVAALDPRFKDLPFLEPEDIPGVFAKMTSLAVKESPKIQVKVEPGLCYSTEEESASREPPLPSLEPVNPVSDGDTTTGPSPSASPPHKKTVLDELFGDVFVVKVEQGQTKSTFELVSKEIKHYQEEKALPLNNDPLLWWKDHAFLYPHLSSLAKRLLGIPATSVPSERVFSTAGDILTAQRSTLKPQYVDMMIFLKKNS